MSIYTRKGDKGFTHRADGRKIPKDDPLCRALGDLDELNSNIGLCTTVMESCTDEMLRQYIGEHVQTLKAIQKHLFEIGTLLGPMTPGGGIQTDRTRVLSEATKELENRIDQMTKESPLGDCFVLPGGSPPGAALHVARTVCRRAERSIVALGDSGAEVSDEVLEYLNRLGDFLFVLAHVVNSETGGDEAYWNG